MADLNTADIINFFNSLNPDQAKKFFDQLYSSSSIAKDALTGLVGKFTSVDKITSTVKQTIQDVEEKIQALKDVDFGNFLHSLQQNNKEIATLTAQVGLLGGAIATDIKPDAFNAMGDAALGMNNDLNKSLDTLGKFSKVIPSFGIAPAIVNGLKIFSELGEPAKKLEAGLLASSAASGELGDFLEEIGEDLDGLERKSITYSEILYQVANATGYNTEQVGKYATELNKIPGSLSTIVDISIDGQEQMHLLQAAMQLSSGTGQSFSQVVDDMSRLYREFATTGEDALEVIAKTSGVSQSIKMPLDLVKEYLGGASQAFRMFGDNSQASLNILGKFGPALREGGLGPRAIADLTQSMTRSIADMGLAQRAFLSATSGGPGGLQGAYQIELLKKQGKVDEVEKMVEQSLRKQFGGKILTLEDASKDAVSAAQFTKQVQLITQGPTKLAGSESEAYQILEAMAKGERGQFKPAEIPTGSEALDTALDIGNKIQERNYNQLVSITNKLDLGAQYAAITANALTRNVLGPGIGEKVITERIIESTENAATQQMIIGNQSLAGTTPEMDLKESLQKRLSGMSNIMDDMKKMYDQMKSGTGAKMQIMSDKFDSNIIDNHINPQPQIQNLIGQTAQNQQVTQQAYQSSQPQIATVEVMSVCQDCNKQIAEKVAVRIVDGKIEQMTKNNAMHMHTGVNLGF